MVTEAMRAVGFTSDDADNQCKRMWIHRYVKKNYDNTPTSVSLQSDGDVLFVSLLGDSLSTFLGEYPDPTLEHSTCKNVTLFESCRKYYNSDTCTQNFEKLLGDVAPYYVKLHLKIVVGCMFIVKADIHQRLPWRRLGWLLTALIWPKITLHSYVEIYTFPVQTKFHQPE